ncbi:hypothetical protein ACROYT_G018674 [Oculina patagonica]
MFLFVYGQDGYMTEIIHACKMLCNKRIWNVTNHFSGGSMKFLVLLGILCVLCLDIGQVGGKRLEKCPKPCKHPVQCFANPCDVSPTKPCDEGLICVPCYCGGCHYTCEKEPMIIG